MILTKTSQVDDVSIHLKPEIDVGDLKEYQEISKKYFDIQSSSNPLNALYVFFKTDIVDKFSDMSPEFKEYWRIKLKKYPIIHSFILDEDVKEFEEISDSIGSFHFASYGDYTTQNIEESSINPLIANKLKYSMSDDIVTELNIAMSSVNFLMDLNQANLLELQTTKDSQTQSSFSSIKSSIEGKIATRFEKLQDIIPLFLQYAGDVSITDETFKINIEGNEFDVDRLLNVFENILSGLKMEKFSVKEHDDNG